MQVIKKILRIAAILNLILIVPLVVATLITSRTSVIANISSFVVLTGSMQPAIPEGSVIYTQRQTSYTKGDIVAFKNGNVNVTHRIIEVSKNNNQTYYTTKGDANNTTDSKQITAADIIGKELVLVPYIGKAIIFFQTPFGFFYAVIFPIIVFIIMEMWNLKKEIEKEAEKKFRKKMKFANENPTLHTNHQLT